MNTSFKDQKLLLNPLKRQETVIDSETTVRLVSLQVRTTLSYHFSRVVCDFKLWKLSLKDFQEVALGLLNTLPLWSYERAVVQFDRHISLVFYYLTHARSWDVNVSLMNTHNFECIVLWTSTMFIFLFFYFLISPSVFQWEEGGWTCICRSYLREHS